VRLEQFARLSKKAAGRPSKSLVVPKRIYK
jgi:hypothetical protein